MTTTTPTIRNGVDVTQIYATLDALKVQPELGAFEFRVSNRWIDGTHSRSTIQGLSAGGEEDASREEPFIVDADEPPVLLGHNHAPNPAEYILHALAGCLTLSIVNIAAARKVELTEVTSTLSGTMESVGAVGIDESVRNGYDRIRVSFSVKGRATPEKLQEIVERARSRSVVYDVITNGVPIELEAEVSSA